MTVACYAPVVVPLPDLRPTRPGCSVNPHTEIRTSVLWESVASYGNRTAGRPTCRRRDVYGCNPGCGYTVALFLELGRPSCRARVRRYVYISVVAASLKHTHRPNTTTTQTSPT